MVELVHLIHFSHVYYVILVGTSLYALVSGGGPERIVALMFLAGSLLTRVVASPVVNRFTGVEEVVFLVDLAMLVSFVPLMLNANRYWTIWICSMQIIQVLSHLPMFFMPDLLPIAYGMVIAIWSYPMLIILAVATFRHRQRVKTFGADRPWSSSLA